MQCSIAAVHSSQGTQTFFRDTVSTGCQCAPEFGLEDWADEDKEGEEMSVDEAWEEYLPSSDEESADSDCEEDEFRSV